MLAVLLSAAFLTACPDEGDKPNQQKQNSAQTQKYPGTITPPEIEEKIRNLGMYADYKQTASGARVYSMAEGVQIPDKVLPTIDAAVDLSIKVQKELFPSWQRGLTPIEYEIMFVQADGLTPNSKVPFITRAGIMTAGTIGTGERPVIFLPEQTLVDWTAADALFWSVYNEGEHLREYFNDRDVFLRFAIAEDTHQHFTIPAHLQPRSLRPQVKQRSETKHIFNGEEGVEIILPE